MFRLIGQFGVARRTRPDEVRPKPSSERVTNAAPDADAVRRSSPPAPAAARGTIQLSIARFVFLAGGLVISTVLARVLGPAQFGQYGVVMSVLTWLELILGVGLTGGVVKLLASHATDPRPIEQTARALFVACSLVLFAAGWTMAPALAHAFSMPSGAVLFRVAMVDLPLMGLFFAYQGILHGGGRFGALSLALIIHTLTKLAGVVLLLALGLSVLRALVAHVLATALVVLYVVLRWPPDRTGPSAHLAKLMVRIAVPLSIYSVALQILSNISLWLLKSHGAGLDESTGFYVAGVNVARALGTIQTVVSAVVFMSVSWAVARGDEQQAQSYLQDAVRFALLALAPGCVLLIMDAEPLVTLVYGQRYAAAAPILRYQAIAFGALALVEILCSALMAAGRRAYSAGLVIALIPLCIALTIALIPHQGGIGAALGLAIPAVMGMIAAMVGTYRRFGAFIKPATVVRVGVATAVFAILSHVVVLTGPWVIAKFAFLLVLYLLLLASLGELRSADLRSFAVWERRAS